MAVHITPPPLAVCTFVGVCASLIHPKTRQIRACRPRCTTKDLMRPNFRSPSVLYPVHRGPQQNTWRSEQPTKQKKGVNGHTDADDVPGKAFASTKNSVPSGASKTSTPNRSSSCCTPPPNPTLAQEWPLRHTFFSRPTKVCLRLGTRWPRISSSSWVPVSRGARGSRNSSGMAC
mgnify:CR=1 FL=1